MSLAEVQSADQSQIVVEQIGTHLGAEISGLELAKPISAEDVRTIEAALVEHEVIVFRDQVMASEQFMQFGRSFGELSVHPFSPADEEAPELIVFRNDETNPPFSTDCWHSDETFRATPPMGTMLRALDVPKFGGDTMFVSMTSAFEGLSDKMQSLLSGLEAYHDFKPFRKLFDQDKDSIKNLRYFEDKYPPVLHPVVSEHPVSGRKTIFVNPQFTIQIKDMEETESRILLNQLFDLAKVPEYQYRHHWENNTLVFWDNRSTQHYAIHDYYPKRRYMERVTLAGSSGPVAAFPPADADKVRNRKSLVPENAKIKHGGHAAKRTEEK